MTEDEEFEALEQRLNMKETKQPEALWLADELEAQAGTYDCAAAAELRRLHALNQELLEALKHGCPPDCKDGMIDSGGVHPWGEPALIPCPTCAAIRARSKQ